MSDFIPFAIPDLGPEEIEEVVDTLKSGWITTGPKTQQFEQDFAKYLGVENALSVNSATAGLHLGLEALGISQDDLVITTPYTFTASAEIIRYLGGHPIFCDIDEDSYNLCPKKLEELLENLAKQNKKMPKAIIPVHFAGLACDMTKIVELANHYKLKVLEDAAHAIPCTHNGKLIGGIGDITVFSFYATKTMTTAEGGMITTTNNEWAKRIKIMRLHGISRDIWNRYQDSKASWYYEVVEPGYKYNLTDIQSSLGIHQLKKVDLFQKQRKAIVETYRKELAKVEGIEFAQTLPTDEIHSHHLCLIKVKSNIRDEFIQKMREKNVQCSVHFIPLHIQPYWKSTYDLKPSDFPIALNNYEQSISLPLFSKMTEEQIDRVIETVKSVVKDIQS